MIRFRSMPANVWLRYVAFCLAVENVKFGHILWPGELNDHYQHIMEAFGSRNDRSGGHPWPDFSDFLQICGLFLWHVFRIFENVKFENILWPGEFNGH